MSLTRVHFFLNNFFLKKLKKLKKNKKNKIKNKKNKKNDKMTRGGYCSHPLTILMVLAKKTKLKRIYQY